MKGVGIGVGSLDLVGRWESVGRDVGLGVVEGTDELVGRSLGAWVKGRPKDTRSVHPYLQSPLPIFITISPDDTLYLCT